MKKYKIGIVGATGAVGQEIELVATKLQSYVGPKTQTTVQKILEEIRKK